MQIGRNHAIRRCLMEDYEETKGRHHEITSYDLDTRMQKLEFGGMHMHYHIYTGHGATMRTASLDTRSRIPGYI